MKKTTFVYSLVSKYKKRPDALLKYGFNYYKSDDNEVKLFAYPIILSQTNSLFKQCVRLFEQCYEQATSEERKNDFKDYQFERKLNPDQHWEYKLVLTDDLIKEFSTAQLCIDINPRESDSYYLYINSPLKTAFYNFKQIEECARNLIKKLIDDKIIYLKKIKYESKKK